MGRKRKRANGIPLLHGVNDKERMQIVRSKDPLRKAIEMEKTTIEYVRLKLRGDPKRKLELFSLLFFLGYGLLSTSLFYTLSVFHVVHTII